MGSGKTTVGKKIADMLGYKFIDSDSEIEKTEKMTINEIFDTKGEEYFRQVEQNFLKSIDQSRNIIVSTGGGMVCKDSSLNLVNEIGYSIYLKVYPKELYRRLKTQKERRPLIKNLSDSELQNHINSQLIVREKYYNKANYIVDASKDINQILYELVERLKK